MRKLAEQVLGHSALVVISIITQAGQGSDVDLTFVLKGPESSDIRCRCHRFQVVQFAKMAVHEEISTGDLFFQEFTRFSITQSGDPDVFNCTATLVVQVADLIPHFLAFGVLLILAHNIEPCPELAPFVDVAIETTDGKYRLGVDSTSVVTWAAQKI